MFKVGDHLVYERNVCKVIEIKEKYYNNNDYYSLIQVDDPSLKRELPVNNEKIRPLMTKAETKKIIDIIPEVPKITFGKENHKTIDTEYRKLLDSDNYEDLITVIKSCYSRIEDRSNEGKPKSSVDESYLELAEANLYTELSIVLGKSIDEIKEMVIKHIN